MAGVKWEQSGFIVSPPKSHKHEGWSGAFTGVWGPYANCPLKGK